MHYSLTKGSSARPALGPAWQHLHLAPLTEPVVAEALLTGQKKVYSGQ